MARKNRNVFFWGTFDIIHNGHLDLFKRSRHLGKVYVIVIPDKELKGVKKLFHNQYQRRRGLLKTGLVEKVFFDSFLRGLKCLKLIQPDLFFLGYDQKTSWEICLKTFLKIHYPKCQIVRGKKYGNIHSSDIKGIILCHCGSGKKYNNCHGKQ
jgi:glycerol-3-phosphate cytidylyltransferase